MRFYLPDYSIDFSSPTCTNPTPWNYSSVGGFATDSVEYEIVGLYRQTQQWSVDSYAYTPNTIFVPSNSVSCVSTQMMGGAFTTLTLVNGAQDAVEELPVDAGYEGLLVYYDQGYSAIQNSLDAYFRISAVVLLAGSAAWLCLLLLFLGLFPLSQWRSVKRMWSLGATTK